jgi:hypothetical protein
MNGPCCMHMRSVLENVIQETINRRKFLTVYSLLSTMVTCLRVDIMTQIQK